MSASPVTASDSTGSAAAWAPANPFPIVGIGSSAGGIEALTRLVRALRSDTGMAFVVVQHLSPAHASMLAEILARETVMPVREVARGMTLAPDHVFVAPPGAEVTLEDGVFAVEAMPDSRPRSTTIDTFLLSLARAQGYRSIAVILSGTGADGSHGCEAINGAGGIAFAQDASAQHGDMPRSARETGCVDFVSSPEEIARELARIASLPHVAQGEGETAPKEIGEAALNEVLLLIREVKGVDFSEYKHNTLLRRLRRRMLLHRTDTLAEYARLLRESPAAVEALFDDLLINVTSFFRNPDVYDLLKTDVFPRLVADRPRHVPVRMWVLGCSTGEEPYSLAIAMAEFLESLGRPMGLQIFATDLNERYIDKARAGVYPKSIARDVSPERLHQFFTEADGGYRISRAIREQVVFARHNALSDPPFSLIDLISCRNLLIYFDQRLQERLIPVLHYALRPDGYLLLGSSEALGSHRDRFTPVDARHRIFARKGGVSRLTGVPALRSERALHPRPEPRRTARGDPTPPADPQRESDRVLLSRYAPPGVLVNGELEILQFRGDTSPYLAPAPGRASFNLLKMLREGLLVGVRGAVQKALRSEAPVRAEKLFVATGDGERRQVDVEVIPVKAATLHDSCLLVLFEDPEREFLRGQGLGVRSVPERAGAGADAADEISRLSQELQATREYLQSVIEQQEAVNEELQSANEEVQSANEELQSINEELETSKEEVQASNEELATVNDELSDRNRELSRSNNDWENLLSSVQMPIVILGPDLRIRRFTPAAERMFQLTGADVGRPVASLRLEIDVPDLGEVVSQVIDTVTPEQREVRDREGRRHLLRVRPYRTTDNRIDGAVVVLVDVEDLKQAEDSLRTSEQRFRVLADSAPVLIWVSGAGGVEFVNRAYLEYLDVPEADVVGHGWLSFVYGGDREAIARLIQDAMQSENGFDTFFRFRRSDGAYRWIKSVGSPRRDETGRFLGHTGCLVDVTDLKEAEEALRAADRSKDQFLAMLSHELRTPLAPLRNVVQMLREAEADQSQLRWGLNMIDHQARMMSRMVDDLLDVSRVTRGKVQLRSDEVDLRTSVERAVEAAEPMLRSREQELTVDLPAEPLPVRGDAMRLEQIFANLLNNASKFSGEKGHVSVRARLAPNGDGPGTVEASVRDDGPGIEPHILKHIFEPFFQADRSLDREKGGLGIGLALVRGLVTGHGGTVQAFSKGAGSGCEVVMRLPAAEATGVLEDMSRESQPTHRQDAVLHRVLVVDDHVDAGETMGMLLRAAGHEVRVVAGGTEALETAPAFEPSVVLLDIGLPGMDGYEVARRLREQFGQRPVLLVAISGYGQDEHRREAREAGFDHFFTKPVSIKTLREFLANPPSRGD